MENFNTELTKMLLQGKNINQLICQQIEKTISAILQSELSAFLNYEKHDIKGYNSGNSRNRYYERKLFYDYRTLRIKIPRNRNKEFEQQLISPYKRNSTSL